MTSQFRASSQLELVDIQIRLAKANLTASAQDRLLEGYSAAVAAFTRANLIVSTTEFKERDEQDQWAKLKLEAHKLQVQYESKLANIQLDTKEPEPTSSGRGIPMSDKEREKIEALYSQGTPVTQIAETLNRPYQSMYGYIRSVTAPKNGKHT